MTSRCEQIRQYLKAQTEPRRASEIAIGIGMPGDIKVSFSLSTMAREGSIAKAGSGKQIYYSFVRDVTPRSKEGSAERRAEYERQRNEERREKRAKARERLGPRTVVRPLPNTLKPRKAIQLAVNRSNERGVAVAQDKKLAAATPVRQRAETIDEFIARGGEIQKLHPWDTSKPLRFLDERFIDLD